MDSIKHRAPDISSAIYEIPRSVQGPVSSRKGGQSNQLDMGFRHGQIGQDGGLIDQGFANGGSMPVQRGRFGGEGEEEGVFVWGGEGGGGREKGREGLSVMVDR